MHTWRCVLAEWQLLRARVLRTRLGLWLALLGGGLAWLALSGGGGGGGAVALEGLARRLGALSAVLCVAFSVGSDLDRAALRLTFTHPTTPTALAAGRWLGATTTAAIVTLVATAAVAGVSQTVGGAAWLRAAAAGVGSAGATAGCALLVVTLGGNALAGVLFFYIVVLSGLHPRGLEPLMAPGVWRSAAAAILQLLPALWRYRGLSEGAVGAWLHALGWMAGGVVLAGRLLGRRGR